MVDELRYFLCCFFFCYVLFFRDEIDEQTAYAEDVSEIVFANERFANFWGSLSEDDKTILMYAMNDMTQAEIAEKMGFKTHSAVGKRLAKLKQKFIEA